MRRLIRLSLMGAIGVAVVGCKSTGSSTAEMKATTHADGVEELRGAPSLTFSRDQRVVDGALTEVLMTKIGSGKYDVSVHTVFVNRRTGETEDNTRDMAKGMNCRFVESVINCIKDMRPVDGALKDVSFQKNVDGTFVIGERSQFVNRETGKVEESSQTYSIMKLTVGA